MKYFEINLSEFIGIKHDRTNYTLESMQELSEWADGWSIDMESGVYSMPLSDNYYYSDIDKAYSYIHKQTNLSIDDIKAGYSEAVEEDFRRALDDSYRSSYENEWTRKFYEAMQENIQEALGSFYDNAYLVYTDKQTQKLHKAHVSIDYSKLGYLWEATTIRVYTTKKQMLEYLKGSYYEDNQEKNDTFDIISDYVKDYIQDDSKPVNTEHIDYYGTLGDSDNWLEYFTEYNETEHTILDELKKKQEKIKAQIKHNVPLQYRIK